MKKVIIINFCLLLLGSLVLFSCNQREEKVEYLLKNQDYISFAKSLEDSMRLKKGYVLDSAFDKKGFFKRIIGSSGKGINNSMKSFEEGIKEGLNKNFKIGQEISNTMGEDGYYNFLKFYRDGKVPHLVFRLFGGTGLNYHDFEMTEIEGKIKIVDCNILVTGENLSKTMRDIMLTTVNPKEILGITITEEIDQDYLNALGKLKGIKKLMANQQYSEAMRAIDSLPEKVKNQKLYKNTQMRIATNLGDDSYLKVIDEYEKLYPNDPSVKLVMMDAYFLRKEFDKILICLKTLENKYGKDPVLDFYYGNIFYQKANYSKAAEYYKKATSRYNDFEMAYNSWLSCAMEIKDYSETIRLANILIDKFGFSKEDIDIFFMRYPDFLASKEYQEQWDK